MALTVEGKKYLTPTEAGRILGVSRWTIRRWLTDPDKRNGHIKTFNCKMNGRLYVDQESLDAIKSIMDAVDAVD